MKKVVRMKYGTKVVVATSDRSVEQTFWDEGHYQKAQEFLERVANKGDRIVTHYFEAVSQPE